MIEDKELGLKIAENTNEAIWERTRKRCESEIKEMEIGIEINKCILALAKSKINGSNTK